LAIRIRIARTTTLSRTTPIITICPNTNDIHIYISSQVANYQPRVLQLLHSAAQLAPQPLDGFVLFGDSLSHGLLEFHDLFFVLFLKLVKFGQILVFEQLVLVVCYLQFAEGFLQHLLLALGPFQQLVQGLDFVFLDIQTLQQSLLLKIGFLFLSALQLVDHRLIQLAQLLLFVFQGLDLSPRAEVFGPKLSVFLFGLLYRKSKLLFVCQKFGDKAQIIWNHLAQLLLLFSESSLQLFLQDSSKLIYGSFKIFILLQQEGVLVGQPRLVGEQLLEMLDWAIQHLLDWLIGLCEDGSHGLF